MLASQKELCSMKLVSWLVRWLFGCLVGSLVAWLARWFVDSLVGSLVGWVLAGRNACHSHIPCLLSKPTCLPMALNYETSRNYRNS